MMDKQDIFSLITNWEYENGESFTDCFDDGMRPITFMTWCLGKGYIKPSKYNEWCKAYNKNELKAHDLNYYLYNEGKDENAMFAVVNSKTGEYNDEERDEAYNILAEFISEIDIYQDRLMEFLGEYE